LAALAYAGPSQGNYMEKVTEEAIRTRAHELWELAGKPDNNHHHFWIEAERELAERRIRREIEKQNKL
jgi:DUF2934 family protein